MAGPFCKFRLPWPSIRQSRTRQRKTQADRIRLFGQSDHVRLYSAPDYIERLQATGFRVSAVNGMSELAEDGLNKFALVPEEQIFVCTKS